MGLSLRAGCLRGLLEVGGGNCACSRSSGVYDVFTALERDAIGLAHALQMAGRGLGCNGGCTTRSR